MTAETRLREKQLVEFITCPTDLLTAHNLNNISCFMLFQFSDENATYILEPITNEVVYNDDPNIMWIQVTRELLP